jgi:hypothetical protein
MITERDIIFHVDSGCSQYVLVNQNHLLVVMGNNDRYLKNNWDK